jgi:hypothetical protein
LPRNLDVRGERVEFTEVMARIDGDEGRSMRKMGWHSEDRQRKGGLHLRLDGNWRRRFVLSITDLINGGRRRELFFL